MAWWRDERGYTLAQFLMASATLGLALAAVGSVIQYGLRQTYVSTHKTEVQQNARVALERMAREIRETTVPLTAATSTSITFTHPTDGVILYTIDGNNNLTRKQGAADPVAVVGGLRNLVLAPQLPLFAYSDVNDNVLAAPVGTPANVYRVTIAIQTGDDSGVALGLSDATAELATSVRLRNL
jgi:hypothetical protein